jgi:CubicO group peptidase (beta-lactamase class C family)
MTAAFTDEGLTALDAVLARHTDSGEVPGLVALVARGGHVHVTSAGHKTLGDGALGDEEPIGRDAIFRIASLSKPITGVAAMLLMEDGVIRLEDPVERWLPELADRRVLRRLDGPLDDTVPAQRAITVEDVLSFHLGFGAIMTLDRYPIAEAEAEIGLKTLGPPWPPTPLTPDEWIAAFGRLPLLDQPGTRWRYNTGATIAGILIERAAGAPLAEVLAKRVFEPLGMTDTAFYVPPDKLHRFTSMYSPVSDGLTLVDAADGWYTAPPALPDGSGGLVSTIDDLWKFAAMLAADEKGLLSPESVRQMLRDRTSARDKAENGIFFGDHSGWGLMISVPAAGGSSAAGESLADSGSSADGGSSAKAGVRPADGTPRGYGWDGGSGTTWRTDPATGLTSILLTQRMATSPAPSAVARDFWTAVRAACA